MHMMTRERLVRLVLPMFWVTIRLALLWDESEFGFSFASCCVAACFSLCCPLILLTVWTLLWKCCSFILTSITFVQLLTASYLYQLHEHTSFRASPRSRAAPTKHLPSGRHSSKPMTSHHVHTRHVPLSLQNNARFNSRDDDSRWVCCCVAAAFLVACWMNFSEWVML